MVERVKKAMATGKRRYAVLGLVAVILIGGVVVWWAFGRPAGKGDKTWQAIQESKLLKVGLDASYPPFEDIDEDTKEIFGYDVDLARLIGERLDVEIEIVNIGFDGLYDALLAGKVDALISGLPYDPRLTEDVAYTVSYFQAGQMLVVAEDEADIESVTDLDGRTLGVELGSGGDMEARQLAKRLEELTLRTYPSPLDTLWGLKNGEVDAVLADSITTYHFIKYEGAVKIVGKPVTDEPYVIAVRHRARRLRDALNAILLEMRDDGTLMQLRDEWL